MSNETLDNIGRYIARYGKQVKSASPEDRQKAYEQGIDFITDLMLARNIEQDFKDKAREFDDKRNEDSRLKKKAMRLAICNNDLNHLAGRIDFFVDYLGCLVLPINKKGIKESCAGRRTKEIKAKYSEQKAIALSVNGFSIGDYIDYGNFTNYSDNLYVVSVTDESILQKLIMKHSLPAPALMIEFKNGRKAGIWQGNVREGLYTTFDKVGYTIDGLYISHEMNLTLEDKLILNKENLDDEGKITFLPRPFIDLLKETKNASETIKRAMIL